MTPPANTERDKTHRFPGDISSHEVGRYARLHLRDRDGQACLCDRGSDVPYDAIRQGCRKVGQDEAQPRRHLLSALAYRDERRNRCERWADMTGMERAASRVGRTSAGLPCAR
jgi:transposase-like protein